VLSNEVVFKITKFLIYMGIEIRGVRSTAIVRHTKFWSPETEKLLKNGRSTIYKLCASTIARSLKLIDRIWYWRANWCELWLSKSIAAIRYVFVVTPFL